MSLGIGRRFIEHVAAGQRHVLVGYGRAVFSQRHVAAQRRGVFLDIEIDDGQVAVLERHLREVGSAIARTIETLPRDVRILEVDSRVVVVHAAHMDAQTLSLVDEGLGEVDGEHVRAVAVAALLLEGVLSVVDAGHRADVLHLTAHSYVLGVLNPHLHVGRHVLARAVAAPRYLVDLRTGRQS